MTRNYKYLEDILLKEETLALLRYYRKYRNLEYDMCTILEPNTIPFYKASEMYEVYKK
jgi:hypothetical protein